VSADPPSWPTNTRPAYRTTTEAVAYLKVPRAANYRCPSCIIPKLARRPALARPSSSPIVAEATLAPKASRRLILKSARSPAKLRHRHLRQAPPGRLPAALGEVEIPWIPGGITLSPTGP